MDKYLVMFEEHRANHYWFDENFDRLLEQYNDEFVAIYNQKVIDHDTDLDALTTRIREKYLHDDIFIEFVSSEKIKAILCEYLVISI